MPLGETSQSLQTPVPKSFYPVSVTQADLNCDAGTFGYGAQVKYGVADNSGVPFTRAGLTPLEQVYINGSVQNFIFLSFATPPQTNAQGQFTDIPIGSCFQVDPFSSLNPCVFVDQHFQIQVPSDSGSPRSINTVTHRKDLQEGHQG